MKVAALFFSLLLTGTPANSEPAPFTPDDSLLAAEITEPVFSANGQWLYYSLTTANRAADRSTSDIWRVRLADGRREAVTRTPLHSEGRPLPAPDGRSLYLLGDAAKDKTTQLWRVRGSARRQITRIPGGISDASLSPDGRSAVVVAEVGRRVGSEMDATRPPPPLVIDRFGFKEDGRGRIDDRRSHLFLVDLGSGNATQLTSGPVDHWLPEWSPDGRLIAFVMRSEERSLDFNVAVMTPQAGAVPRRLSPFSGADNDPAWDSRLAWSPDSRRLAWLTGGKDKWIYYAPTTLSVADVATGSVTTPGPRDQWVSRPRWSADGRALLALVEQDRATIVARIDPGSAAITPLTEAKGVAYDLAVSATGEVAVLDSSDAAPARLRQVGADGATLADHNPWLADRRLNPVRPVSFASDDGTVIHGLLTLPADAPAGQPLPLIVRLHGGPVYQFAHEFMLDWQVYASAGYAVLGVNPRGSSGRGFAFASAIHADWGNRDVADVRAGIAHLVTAGIARADQIGAGGWSYGGILTDYLIASEPGVRAAVSGAGAANVLALYGADQYAREYELELGTPWENAETYMKLSTPFLKAGAIRTPTLFLCAEADDNVPCLGSEQMYQALRSRGIATQLVVYPGETHTLSVPSYIVDRLSRSLDWYDRHLRGGAR